MKKHLVAVAVAASFAAPSMAQVTVSGTIDSGFTSLSHGVGATTQKTSLFDMSKVATSEIVLSGSEDLGGGLKASFKFSNQIGSGTDTVAEVGTPAHGALGQRDTIVSLEGGFGKIDLGRFTPATETIGNSFVYATANFIGHGLDSNLGTATSNLNGASGVAAMSAFTPYVSTTAGTVDALAQADMGRGASTLQYTSPVINGFQVVGGVRQNKYNGATSAVTQTTSQSDLGFTYKLGNLRVGASSASLETDATTSTLLHEANVSVYGAEYNFGVAKVAYAFAQTDSLTNGVTSLDQSLHSLSVEAPFGATTLKANMGAGENKILTGAVKYDLTSYQFGAYHALSKRTSVYGVIGENSGKKSDTGVTSKIDGYAIGLIHKF